MKKLWVLAIVAASLVGCGDDSKKTQDDVCGTLNMVSCNGECVLPCDGDQVPDPNNDCACPEGPVTQTCEAQGKVTCNGVCYDACEGGAARDSNCQCPTSPADKTCEDQGKVTCNNMCYTPCADGAALDAECKCPEAPADKTCEDQGKVTCNGECYDPCADGAALDSNCLCPEAPGDQTCEDQGKVTCNNLCYSPCADGSELDAECKCPEAPADKTCEEQNKVECNGKCYEPCEDGAALDENCQCPGAPVDKTCEEQNKVECKGECYEPCADGAALDANCQCPAAPEKPKTCEKSTDCDKGTPYCVKGVCKADKTGCDCEVDSDKEYTCKDYDASIDWAEGGHAICSDMCELLQGSCKTAAVCGNGIVEDGEKCDFGTNDKGKVKESTTCSKYAPQYASGNVTCTNNCTVLDDSKCVASAHEGLYYCQLMAPDKIVFGPDVAEATLNGRVAVAGVTDKTTGNDGGVEAELVYGTDLEHFSSWKSIAATADTSFSDKAVDAYTASLTKAKYAALESEKVYYTFRFREKSTDEWKYCKSNSDDPNQVKGTIGFIEVTESGTDANVHEIGVATSSNVSESNILAQFTFDSHTASESNATATHAAEVGTGSIQGKKTQCDSKGCFANDDKDGMAWNIRNWKKAKTDALKDGAHILITGLSTTGAQNIGLDMRVYRSNNDNEVSNNHSPTNIVVMYSLNDKDYEEARDVELKTDQIKVFFDYATILPSAAENQSKLSLKLVPYGGSALIRLDDITISKNHAD